MTSIPFKKIVNYLLIIMVFSVVIIIVGGWFGLLKGEIFGSMLPGLKGDLQNQVDQLEYDLDSGTKSSSSEMLNEMIRVVKELNEVFSEQPNDVCKIDLGLKRKYGEKHKGDINEFFFKFDQNRYSLNAIFIDTLPKVSIELNNIKGIIHVVNDGIYLIKHPSKLSETIKKIDDLKGINAVVTNVEITKRGEVEKIESRNSLTLFKQKTVDELFMSKKEFNKQLNTYTTSSKKDLPGKSLITKYVLAYKGFLIFFNGDNPGTGWTHHFKDYESAFKTVPNCVDHFSNSYSGRSADKEKKFIDDIIRPFLKATNDPGSCTINIFKETIDLDKEISINIDQYGKVGFLLAGSKVENGGEESLTTNGIDRILIIQDVNNFLKKEGIRDTYEIAKSTNSDKNKIFYLERAYYKDTYSSPFGVVSSTNNYYDKYGVTEKQNTLVIYNNKEYGLKIGKKSKKHLWKKVFKFDRDLVFIVSELGEDDIADVSKDCN